MPDWIKYIRENLPLREVRGEMEREIIEEVAAHLEGVFQDARANGATEEAAEAQALDQIEDWEKFAHRIRRTRRGAAASRIDERMGDSEVHMRERGGWWVALSDLLGELRITLRRLKRKPGFTAVILFSLGLGIGATTAIFSVVKGVLLDPLPYDAPDRLVAVWNRAPGLGEELLPQSFAFNAVYEDEARAFEHVGLWNRNVSAVMGSEGPEEVPVVQVTHGIFPALGVQPFLGRGFTFEDTQVGSPRTVILAYRYWENRFGSDSEALGQTLEVTGIPREIIGVMPEGFRFMDLDPDLYHPFRYTKASLNVTNFVYQSIGRLRLGVTIEQALADLKRVTPMAPERYPGGMTVEMLEEIGGEAVLRPLKEELVGSVGRILWVVLGGVAIILLVACANVANLLLVQAESRERALAVQAVMGSPRGRILGQFMMESVTLGVLGGLLGVVLAHVGLRVLRSVGPGNLPRLHEISLEPGILLFALALSVASGVVLGLLPLARAWRMDLAKTLKEGGRGSSYGRSRNRARNTLAVAQLALALVLLVGSGLMVRSFISLSRVNPGFSNPAEVLTFRATATGTDVPDDEEVARAHETLARQLAELPGVVSVGISSSVPMDHAAGFDPIFVEDFPLPEGQPAQIRRFKWIGGGYHEAIGNPVIAGRPITWTDIHTRARIVMITEGMAREYWGDPARAVGRTISTGYGPGDWREIVGVVGDVRDDGVDQEPVEIVYWPMVLEGFWSEIRGDALFLQRTMVYVVRSPRVGTPGFLEEIQEAVWAMFPGRPLATVRTLDTVRKDSMARASFTLVMLAIAAAVALLLGTIGIYGVISYSVGQRTRELGLRMAMGAEAGTVVGMVLRQGLALALAGTAIGIAAAAGVTRLMDSILFGVSPVDPPTFAVVSLGLVLVALMASYLPARRASRVDPTVALRAE